MSAVNVAEQASFLKGFLNGHKIQHLHDGALGRRNRYGAGS